MEEWTRLVRESVTEPEVLAEIMSINKEELEQVHKIYPLRINPYYLGLIKEKGDPIWSQVIPDVQELSNIGLEDPLEEEKDSPVKAITHRYSDRVLFYISHTCSTYCRFCTRKRKVGDPDSIHDDEINEGLEYIDAHEEIRDVVLSGGDPLMLSNDKLEWILKRLRDIQHVEIIRIGTRIPVTLPQRVTEDLCGMLKKYHPLYINTHFNHPREITAESRAACTLLADAGIPLGNQSVLLKGVNDKKEVMLELVRKLLSIRIKPYYLYQMDFVKGADHFRTPVKKGMNIISSLRGQTSGMAVPHFVIDSPCGGGKISLIPNPIVESNEAEILFRNYNGKLFKYPEPKCE